MLWFVGLIVVVVLIIWLAYIKPFSYWTNMGVIQSKPWIVFGDAWPTFFRRMNLPEWLDWLYYMYPGERYVGVYQLYLRTLVLRDPDLIKQLTIKDFDHFTDHNSFTVSDDLDPFLSKNLFALKGQRWRDIRALLSGSFTSSKMKTMYNLISETSGNFVQYFLKQNKDFIEVEMKDNFTRYTNDVIASTSFGIKVNSLEDPKNEFYLMGKEATNFQGVSIMFKFIGLICCPWLMKALKISFFTQHVIKFFNELISETIKVREKNGIVRPDMINILLEAKKGITRNEEKEVLDTGFAVVDESLEMVKPQKRQIEMTNTDITAQAMIFFVAGFDSVASGMSFAAYELAVNPDVQDNLRKEIRETLEECDGDVTYETLLKMKYMDMVVSESLRMWSAAPAFDRVCVKPYTLKSSKPGEPTFTLKKNDTLLIPISSIHHDPTHYPEPHKFIPERFSDENKKNIKPYTYMPFGVGPRACIGSRFALLEIKSVLFHLLNSFEIVPVEKTAIPLKIAKSFLNIAPVGGFPLGLKRLKN